MQVPGIGNARNFQANVVFAVDDPEAGGGVSDVVQYDAGIPHTSAPNSPTKGRSSAVNPYENPALSGANTFSSIDANARIGRNNRPGRDARNPDTDASDRRGSNTLLGEVSGGRV